MSIFKFMGGNKKRKTEKKAFTFGGSWSGSNVGGDDTSLNEGQDTVTSETLTRVEEKENERSNDNNALQQAYLQTTKPVINTPAPVTPKPEPKIQFMAPEPEPSKLSQNTGITISSNDNSVVHRDKFPENTGATISTYSGGEKGPKLTSNVYEDPNTGSTIATKEARQNIADGGNYYVLASTNQINPTMGASQIDPDGTTTNTITKAPVQTGDILKSGPDIMHKEEVNPYAQEQQRILTNTYNPRPSEDLATGEPLQYSSSTSTTAINPRINSAVRRALISLGKAGGQLRRYFVR